MRNYNEDDMFVFSNAIAYLIENRIEYCIDFINEVNKEYNNSNYSLEYIQTEFGNDIKKAQQLDNVFIESLQHIANLINQYYDDAPGVIYNEGKNLIKFSNPVYAGLFISLLMNSEDTEDDAKYNSFFKEKELYLAISKLNKINYSLDDLLDMLGITLNIIK